MEDAFGILTARFRMYRRTIEISPSTAEACVKATCVLHNYILLEAMRGGDTDLTINHTPSGLQSVQRMGSRNATVEAFHIRDKFCAYFNGEGAVSWQDNIFDI